ncbi:valine N-monooxygenase 1 [Artemisia annua]|uniref:Valine N-monooxygenase 1 n=1 Tax=Artemisia annua TaxID=35608 RepID=A0A2U1LEK4_ARTAN|nr:valine N-monooxygenase 1 [Artemisia annua]
MLRNKPTFEWIHRMTDEMNTKILCIRLGHVHVIATLRNILTTEISSVARLKWLENKPHDVADNLLREAIHATRKYQDPLIDERIQQWKDGISNVEDDLLDVLINHDNPRLTTDQIKAQCLELMLAMVDNPSNSIEWAIAERINQPRLFDKAVHELDCLVGTDRLVQESDISKHVRGRLLGCTQSDLSIFLT